VAERFGASPSETPFCPDRAALSSRLLAFDAVGSSAGSRSSARLWTSASRRTSSSRPQDRGSVFFAGRHDYNTPSELAERYYQALDAPRGKHFLWFEDAGHMLPYEVPGEDARALVERVLAETRGR
jgi:pimeloyl-ACP methyl ester carboxylesterase